MIRLAQPHGGVPRAADELRPLGVGLELLAAEKEDDEGEGEEPQPRPHHNAQHGGRSPLVTWKRDEMVKSSKMAVAHNDRISKLMINQER